MTWSIRLGEGGFSWLKTQGKASRKWVRGSITLHSINRHLCGSTRFWPCARHCFQRDEQTQVIPTEREQRERRRGIEGRGTAARESRRGCQERVTFKLRQEERVGDGVKQCSEQREHCF